MDPTGPGATPDEALVQMTLQGNQEGYRALVERYWPVMVALALCRVKDSNEAEDVAQEAFIRAHGALARLRRPARFGGWLARIVRNLACDSQKRRARERTTSMADLNELPAAQPPPVLRLSEAQRRRIWEAVAGLPEKLQTVVLMRFVSSLSTPEIARRLGQPPSTVRVRLHRALKRLRGRIEPSEMEPLELERCQLKVEES